MKQGYLLRKGLLNSAPNRKDDPTQYIYFLYSSASLTVVTKLTIGAMHALQIKINKLQEKMKKKKNQNRYACTPTINLGYQV